MSHGYTVITRHYGCGRCNDSKQTSKHAERMIPPDPDHHMVTSASGVITQLARKINSTTCHGISAVLQTKSTSLLG